jgi:uncharacterized protein (DUF305 family)
MAATACGSATGGTASPSLPMPVSGQGDSAAIAKARADSAIRPYTAADIHFMSGMIGHHAQAMVMSKLAPSRGASASVRTLAERIVNGQEDEIATMQRWLRDRRQPVPEARPGPMKMTMGGVEHDMLMPGMLSEAQMRQLELARGAEFDRLFLTFMIQHHRGAVTMVEALFATYGAGQDHTVFKLASDVNVDQTTEIARMQQMLAEITLGVPIK